MTDISLRIDPKRDVIDQLVDQMLILTTEAQTLFAERYAEYSWRVDLSDDKPVFWFEREPAAIFRPHFIGSTSGISQTWLWGWDNINGFPEETVEVATGLHEIASQFDAPELTTAQLPLDQETRATESLPDRTEYSYVYAAMAVSGLRIPVYYRAPTGQDSYAWFVLDNESEFNLPEPTPLGAISAITQALESGLLQDHRLAVRSYGKRREGIALSDEDGTLSLVTPSGTVIVEFDDLGRINHIGGTTQAQTPVPESSPAEPSPTGPSPTGPSETKGFLGRLFGKRN